MSSCRLNRVPLLAWIVLALLIFSVSAKAQSIDTDLLTSKIEPEIQKMMIEGKIPSAAIALVIGEKIVWTGGYGYSNLWAKTPAVPSTVYIIGSTFKAMSTYALLQQMEQGKFKLDDPVNNYLDEFKIQGENSRHPVTFRHLLTHTSGLPNDFGPHPVWGETVPPPLKDYLRECLKLQSQPSTRQAYSNVAFTLVGYLVEKFSGVPFKQYIQEHIFNVLEMHDTAFEPRPDMVERLAIPYVFNRRTWSHNAIGMSKANVWPAGIVYGTVLDQANWLIANINRGVFKGKRFISEGTFQEMMTRQYDKFAGPIGVGWLNETTGFGLTWWISQLDGETVFAHSGSVSGYTAFLAGNLGQKIGFAILTNANKVHRHVFELAVKALDILESFKRKE